MFKLDQNPNGKGLCCNGDGLFFANDALLQRDPDGNFEARSDIELKKSFGCACSNRARLESHVRSVKLVAAALNKGDMARAMMTAVLMRLPDPHNPIRASDENDVLAKAGYNSDEPRDERGRWTNDGGGSGGAAPLGSVHGDPRIQLADDARSDAPNDPVAEAAARAAEAQRNSGAPRSQAHFIESQHADFWQTITANLLHRAQAAASEIGHAEIISGRANLTASTAEAHTIARAYDRVMGFQTGGSIPITPETPIWGAGPTAENAPERRIVSGDFIEPPLNLATILPWDELFVGARQVAQVVNDERQTFIVLPRELPKGFDIKLPVGRYAIPEDAVPGTTKYGDLVHEQIGNLVRDRLPDIKMILRTSPGVKGVDIELPELNVPELGARYLEIKPLTQSGFNRFRVNIERWKLSEPVLPITYDREGNIYYGFPK